MMHGREKAVRFGTSASLVGIVTEPAAGTETAGKPAMVLLNSGILHRVGSCRVHARIARALSLEGYTTLRFDFSGIGDSDQRRDSLPFEESAVVETREAMDYLGKLKGTQRFVLAGLCSGADMAHETALVDQRVVGLLMLDAWAYRTSQYYLRHYGKRVLKLQSWMNFARRRLDALRGRERARPGMPTGEGVEFDVPKYVRVFPPRERVERDLRQFVDRKMALYCLWTGGLEDYNHRGQYEEAFSSVPFGGLLREEHIPEADHILTGLEHQDYVVRNTVEWMKRLDGAAAQVNGRALMANAPIPSPTPLTTNAR